MQPTGSENHFQSLCVTIAVTRAGTPTLTSTTITDASDNP
jgi:hypothetical protein